MNRWMKRRIERSRERCERVEEQQKKANRQLPRQKNRADVVDNADSSHGFMQRGRVIENQAG